MRHRTVSQIMSCAGVCQRPPQASVRDACRLMARHRCGSVLVVDRERLIGIFTERDAVERVFARGLDPDLTFLAEVMTRDPETIGPNESVDDVVRRMDEFGYRHIPVVEGQAGRGRALDPRSLDRGPRRDGRGAGIPPGDRRTRLVKRPPGVPHDFRA